MFQKRLLSSCFSSQNMQNLNQHGNYHPQQQQQHSPPDRVGGPPPSLTPRGAPQTPPKSPQHKGGPMGPSSDGGQPQGGFPEQQRLSHEQVNFQVDVKKLVHFHLACFLILSGCCGSILLQIKTQKTFLHTFQCLYTGWASIYKMVL